MKPAKQELPPPNALAAWQRIRKYAVPRSMIERATERRLARDWRGACAAANMDVTFDLADVRRQWSTAVADAVEGDLAHLAPDLVRWHIPRYPGGRTTIQPRRRVLLARYGAGDDAPCLHLAPLKFADGPQRLSLGVGPIGPEKHHGTRERRENWATSRHLWDVRRAGELRERCGGDERAPFLNTDGTPRRVDGAYFEDGMTTGRAAWTEWVTVLKEEGEVGFACDVLGLSLDDTPPRYMRGYEDWPGLVSLLSGMPLDLARVEPELRRLRDAGFGRQYQCRAWYRSGWRIVNLQPAEDSAGVAISFDDGGWNSMVPTFPEACWKPQPDLGLLRSGLITPDLLHPLVSASLCPGRVPSEADGPPPLEMPARVRVRCRDDWHEVKAAGDGIQIPHSDVDVRREHAVRALGGQVAGCFAVQHAWTSGTGRLPKTLRGQREDFFQRVHHGDTQAVLQLLDAGIGHQVRDGRQRTLLHHLSLLDWKVLLPLLLKAGLDLEARDHHLMTPLHVASGQGPLELVHALLDAGARIDVADFQGKTIATEIRLHKRRELYFLKEAIQRDYPRLIEGDYMWTYRGDDE